MSGVVGQHRTLAEATASPPAANRRAQQQAFDEFRREYNHERPHQATKWFWPADWRFPRASGS